MGPLRAERSCGSLWIVNAQGEDIAQVDHRCRLPYAESEALGALFAAAPDLLADAAELLGSLDLLRGQLAGPGPTGDLAAQIYYAPGADSLRAAVARARGGT